MHIVFLVAIYLLAVAIVTIGGLMIVRQRKIRVGGGRSPLEPVPASARSVGIETQEPALAPKEEEPPAPIPLSAGMARTRGVLGAALARMRMRGGLNDEFWVELEETLLVADIGLMTAQALVSETRSRYRSMGLNSSVEAVDLLRQSMVDSLDSTSRELVLEGEAPHTILLVGVNGAGKTTTIGKLAKVLSDRGHSIVLAAGDTFRAAASEQLDAWALRADVEIVKGFQGGDPASVVFDAASKAKAKGADVVIADTAGRLQTSSNLMEELKKIRRVSEKAPGTLCEVLLVIDATTGQNGLSQAKSFTEAAGTTGVVLTKLDGSAKGGVAFAIERELGIPIKFVGTGEAISDLIPFDPVGYVNEICGFGE